MEKVKFPSKIDYKSNWVTFSFTDETDENNKETSRATSIIPSKGSGFSGKLVLPNGSEGTFIATRKGDAKKDDDKDKKRMFNDYGQQYDRQSLRKDFNPKLTKSKVLSYNDKRLN